MSQGRRIEGEMIQITQAQPNGEPALAICTDCRQYWNTYDPELDFYQFVRIHLRNGNRYRPRDRAFS